MKPAPTEDELRAVGLTLKDFENEKPEEITMSSDMCRSWDVFCAMQTQLRSSGVGAYGFDYNVLPFLFDVYNVDDKEATLNDIRIMEAKMLEMIAARSK